MRRLGSAWLILTMALALALVLASCSPVPTDPAEEDGEPIEEPDVQVEPTLPSENADFSYLAGVWTVQATLADIDEGAMSSSADRPNQRWECQVAEGTMTLITDTHTYVGPIEPELDNGWVFIAAADLQDKDGVTWTNLIEIHGKRMGETTFAGGMELTVDSSARGHQYTATYDIEARKQ